MKNLSPKPTLNFLLSKKTCERLLRNLLTESLHSSRGLTNWAALRVASSANVK